MFYSYYYKLITIWLATKLHTPQILGLTSWQGICYKIIMPNPAIADLQSVSASGQIGKTSVYYVRNGEQCKRAYVVPVQPRTPRQLSSWGFFSHGMTYWKDQDQAFRDSYNQGVKDPYMNMWGVNLFLREWMKGEIVLNCIRSLQAGEKVCGDGDNDVAINEVVIAKSVVHVGTYYGGSSFGASDEYGICGAKLTSTTNLRINGHKGAIADAPIAAWQVVEYY